MASLLFDWSSVQYKVWLPALWDGLSHNPQQPSYLSRRCRSKAEQIMEISMKTFTKVLIGAGVGLALTAGTASAAVVCNEEGDCWRVSGEPRYEPSLKLRIHKDDWKWKEGERYRWREPGRGSGYWRNGVWIEIR